MSRSKKTQPQPAKSAPPEVTPPDVAPLKRHPMFLVILSLLLLIWISFLILLTQMP